MPDDASWLDGVVVPDDPSELQADIEAYHRERRHHARQTRLARLTGYRWWQRFALPAAVVVGSLTVAAAVLGILTLERPQPLAGPPRAPIATAPAAETGQLDGLVPDVVLGTSTGSVHLRDMRPALVALVPTQCDCTDLLGILASQANEFGLGLVVVAPTAQDAEIASLPGRLHRGTVVPAYDANGELASTYGAIGVTVLTLRPDGTVGYVDWNVDKTVRLEGPLGEMVSLSASLRSG